MLHFSLSKKNYAKKIQKFYLAPFVVFEKKKEIAERVGCICKPGRVRVIHYHYI
jgi:hypothetical protein